MSENADNVHVLMQGSPNAKALDKLVSMLADVDWDMQIQLIAKNSGLPLSDNLEQQDAQLGQGSVAQSFGHHNLHEFITRPLDQGGVGWDWGDWTQMVKAKRYHEQFNIASENPEQIIKQFDEVMMSLGRAPSNSEEFHMAREAILTKQTEASEERRREVEAALKAKIQESELATETVRQRLEEEKGRYAKLELKREEDLHALEALLKEERTEDNKRQLVALEEEISVRDNEIERLRVKLADFDKQWKTKKIDYKETLEKIRTESSERQERVNILSTRIERLVRESGEKDRAIEESSRALLDREKELSAIQDEVEKFKTNQTAMSGEQMAEYTARMQQAEQVAAEAAERMEQAEAQAAAATIAADKASALLIRAKTRVSEMEGEFQSERDSYAAAINLLGAAVGGALLLAAGFGLLWLM